MRNSTFIKSFLLLCALIVGAGTSWAETEVLSWTARTTSDGSDTYTSGYTYSTNKISGKNGYVQDSGAKDETIVSIALFKTDAPLFTTTPNLITFKAKLGGGSVKDQLGYNIYACFVDNTGANIEGSETIVTTKITETTGSNFIVEMPKAYATSAYGIKIYHMKEDGWNARYYNFSLTYSDQINATWDISPSIAKVTIGGSTVLDLTTDYDGTLSFVSDNTDIATVSYNTSNKKITVNGIAAGSTTISVTGDATETFNAIDETIVVLVRKDLAANCIMYESFDENDEVGGNDGKWKDIAITPTPIFDLEGWTYSTAYGASRCVRIGKNGWFLSPALGVTGDVTLKFVTESWGTDGSNGYVDIVGGGTFDDSESINGVTIQTVDGAKTRAQVTLKKTGTWTEYTLKIIGVTADSQIKFLGPKDKRIFFDEVEVLLDKTLATVTAAGWATWIAPLTVEVPSTVKAYYVKVNGNKTSLTEKSVIPAGIPVLLQGEGVHEFTVTDVVPNEAIDNDLLISGAGDIPQNPYVLAKPAGKSVGFYKWTDTAALPTGKVYIECTPSNAPDFISLGDDATGIEDVVKSEEIRDKSYYNLSGQRVAQPSKGLYIVNGKKVIIK